MSSTEEYKFSGSGSLLAVTHPDGRLSVWSAPSLLSRQYVPSSHLSAACTCLAWAPPKQTNKKKKKDQTWGEDDLVALGTVAGTVLLYSVKQGDLVTVLSKPSTQRINGVAWSEDGETVWAGGQDGTVAAFSVSKLGLDFSFSSGTDPVFSLAVLPESQLATASRSIKIWKIDKRNSPELQQTFTGHATEVKCLQIFSVASASFLVSAAADDRTISVWRVSESHDDNKNVSKGAWASLSVNEGVRGVSFGGEEGANMVIGVVTKQGALQIFKHHVGERKKKPIKPKHVVQVTSDKDSSSGKLMPIPVMACHFTASDVTIAHGSNVKPSLETLPISSLEKEHCLVREAPISRLKADQQIDHSKTITPDTNGDIVFLAPGLSQPAATGKLGKRAKSQKNQTVDSLPVEERLALLSNQSGAKGAAPRTDTLAQLLVQGLHGKDGRILDSVLDRADQELIDNTVRRIPAEAVVPLVTTLQKYVKGRGMVNSSHAKWLRSVLTLHTGFLVSVPDCQELLGPVYALLEARTGAYNSVLQLRGKLDLVIKQKSGRVEDAAVDADQEALVVYQDESSDELEDVLEDLLVPASDTDDNWDDDDEEEEGDDDNDVELVNGDGEENEVDMEDLDESESD